ncbi:MAG TPA: glycoside hydrolase family 15 protein [Bryobacteraceae bacterium]|nr:glycoside hydrolase family 15 protein [Bryobacteraceae bacterium]
MERHSGNQAFGGPGIEPRWTHGNKNGVGTAYAASSRIWFTLFGGVVTEMYYPTVDRPQLRDLQYLVTDGKSFFHEEKRDLDAKVERLSGHTLGFRCTNSAADGRYSISKEVITDPHLPCVLQRTRLIGPDEAFLATLKMYALCAPHLQVGGYGNTGYLITANGARVLMATKQGVWLAMAATVPFSRTSCGYVGTTDGWTDLHENLQMDYEFDLAVDGNIALTAELDLSKTREFTLAAAFGSTEHRAITNLLQSLGTPFEEHLARYEKQWDAVSAHRRPLEPSSFDHGNLFKSSFSLLLAHEDKSFPGALIASLAIPWGEAKGDQDQGGYHLVWTRDMVNSATALLAAGDTATPLRALIFLAVSQHQHGGFAQNFWVNGDAYWKGIQLDEVAFPIILAWRLFREKGLGDFNPETLVRKAAAYLIRHGPVTQEERWEEASGYSPSTLASNIAALICAAVLFRERGEEASAQFVEEYADFLESHIEDWMVTNEGSLCPGINRYYIRILPEQIGDANPAEDPESRTLHIANLPSGQQSAFPAKDVVDGGFLELVRYGIRSASDPIIVDTVKVIDAVLKVETDAGPVWRRYNHDGYGQQEDGGPFTSVGRGRAWPLLTGERGHYELAAGRSAASYIRAMEQFASSTGLLPEQVWDEADKPEAFLFLGKPTGSAMPLMWAHAEYIKLLRSASDGKVFDAIPEVQQRYLGDRKNRKMVEVWKPDRQSRFMRKGSILRIHGAEPFRLHWSSDGWKTVNDTDSNANALEIDFVDLPSSAALSKDASIRFTFFWRNGNRWEGRDYEVTVQ